MSEQDEAATPALIRQGELISEIGGLLPGRVDGEWASLVYTVNVVTMYAEDEVEVHRPNGSTARTFSPHEVIDLVEELREVMYRPGAGTWISSRWTVTNEGDQWSTQVTFNYDDEPNWSSPVDPGLYGLDLEDFPRRDDAIPDWMKAKIAEARARAK